MPSAFGLAIVLGGIALLWGGARLFARRSMDPTAMQPPADAAPRATAAALVGIALALAGPMRSQPVWVAAAAAAALCTAAAIGARREIGAAFCEPAYALPSLVTVAPGTPGSISPVATVAAAAAAAVLATLAFRVRLIGPSDAGLVALAAFLASLLESWLSSFAPAAGPARLLPALAAAAAGSAIAAGFSVLLP